MRSRSSCVRLEAIEMTAKDGPVLHVLGADLRDNTPILDIKPYIRYTDCQPDAVSGFADGVKAYRLEVIFPEELLEKLPEEKRRAAVRILEEDRTLKENGIYVRWFSKPLIRDYLRISIGTDEEMDCLLSFLRQYTAD